MDNPWARDRATLFYLGYALFGLLVVAVGFGFTYALPMSRGTFFAPWFVHLHGASSLAWVLLVIGQAALVKAKKTPWHRKAGQTALPLALVIWASGIATAAWAASRDISEQGTIATSALSGTVTGLSLFVLLVGAALVARRRLDWHKRLILLATIHVLWPAFFRLRHWFPAVPEPEIWLALVLAYSPIIMAAARDRWIYGKVHPVWLIIAPVLVFEQSIEVASFDRGFQRALGQWLYAFLT
jgi:uncharacterized membrane protein YozB (DUF420 family)